MQRSPHDNRGFVTLLATLVITVVGMILAYTLLHESGWRAGTVEALERSFNARTYAETCAEYGLLHITEGESFETEGSAEFAAGSCEYEIVGAEPEYLIQSVGSASGALRRLVVRVESETIVTESGTTTNILNTKWSESEQF